MDALKLQHKGSPKADLAGRVAALAAEHTAAMDALQQKVDANKAQEAKEVRGQKLRELQAFFALEENDPKGEFSGLQRVLTPDGSCVWTTPEDVEAMKADAQVCRALVRPY